MMVLSMYAATNLYWTPRKRTFIKTWNVAGAFLIPCGIVLHLYLPNGVINPVLSLESGCNGIW